MKGASIRVRDKIATMNGATKECAWVPLIHRCSILLWFASSLTILRISPAQAEKKEIVLHRFCYPAAGGEPAGSAAPQATCTGLLSAAGCSTEVLSTRWVRRAVRRCSTPSPAETMGAAQPRVFIRDHV